MAIHGVKGNILELLVSNDKSVKDFMSSLKQGDTLRGRVVDIIPVENKAIINFKGYNMISQLPQDATIQKGDTINVTVSQMENKVFMKINTSGFGRSVETQQGASNAMTPQQIIQSLNSLKIPVNEQNVYIAQKLMDYHLSVTAQNVADINEGVNNYLQSRGIDPKAMNIDSLAAAKDIVFSNFFKLGMELQKAADSLRGMAQVMETRGQHAMTRNEFLANRNDAAIRALNMSAVLSSAAAATGGSASLNSDQAGMLLSLSKADNAVINRVLNAAVIEGAVTAEQAAAALKALTQEKVSLKVGQDINIIKNSDKVDIRYSGTAQNLETIVSGQGSQSVNALKDAMLDNIFAQKNNAAVTVQSAITHDLTGILTTDAKALAAQAGEIFSSLNRNIFTPQNTSLNENVKDTSALLKSMQTVLGSLSGQLNSIDAKAAGADAAALGAYKAGVNLAGDASKNVMKVLNSWMLEGEITVKPRDYSNYQMAIKDYILKIADVEIFKNPGSFSVKQGAVENAQASVRVELPVDVESTIEAMIFLKSRNLPQNNKSFVDIMSRYFKDDMKLNRSIETLSTVLSRLETAFKSALNRAEAKNILENISSVKNIITDITVKTNDSNLKSGIMEAQLRNFIDKSGLNLENKLLNQAIMESHTSITASPDVGTGKNSGLLSLNDNRIPDAAKNQVSNNLNSDRNFSFASGDNMKSKLTALLNSLNITDDPKVSAAQKSLIRQVREATGDLLTNLNALSLMNQRPVSFDMAYTQIPVFFNNKLFNGELQVWFRKGATKEELQKTNTPVNMVFMLNTSNLGQVKVSMTVFKNEVECTVKAVNEKAKQVLMRNKNDFLGSLQGLKYSVKNFNVQLEEGAIEAPSSGEGYINVGRINLQA